MSRIDQYLISLFLLNDLTFHRQIDQMLLHIRRIYTEQFCCTLKELVFRKIYMSLPGCLQKSIYHSTFYSVIWICMNSNAIGDLICNFESHTTDIICKSIRVFLQNTVNRVSILLVDFGTKVQWNPIFLQKHHCLPHIGLFRDLHGNLSCLFFTDSLNFRQSFRLIFYYLKRIISKMTYDPSRQRRANSFNRTRTEVSFHSQCIFRHFFSQPHCLKLLSINRMLCKIPLQFYRCSLCDHRKTSNAGQLIFLADPF